jgi:DNA-binding winged helix-turn-helix (wHTH) protein
MPIARGGDNVAVRVDTPDSGSAKTVPAGKGIQLGLFTLYPDQHLLHLAGEPVRIGSRALSLLIALVEKRGELVSKETLIARVWPETFVEEANLRVHIAALRKVLGDTADPPRYIANVSGRGYRLVAPLPADETGSDGPRTAALTRLIGRGSEVATLVERVARRRLITISGPGGIGKTSVAFAVGQELQEAFEDRVVTVDLGAAAADASGLPQAIAMALKVSINADDGIGSLSAFLNDKNLLLVLDNCEHIIDAVTEMTELLLRQAPRLHILATSTEPMRAEGEWIFRLLPLEVPSEAENLPATEALGIPAVELFVERAAASSEVFRFADADVPLVTEICRRLDGNALAI